MRINFQPLAEEIITEALNPDRIQRLSVIYNFEFKDWTYPIINYGKRMVYDETKI